MTAPQETAFFSRHYQWTIFGFAAAIFISGIVSPPYLMDDVDAVQAQIARNMLQTGDFVTARLDGVPYMEKAPLKYWLIAAAFQLFGVHDWAARLVIALAAIGTVVITGRFAAWAFGNIAALYSGITLATCVGLFLFTRFLIPDALLTFFIVIAMWSLLRALEPGERLHRWWARGFWASMAFAVLTKGLIGLVFPAATTLLYLLCSRQLLRAESWKRLLPLQGLLIFVVIAAPWHIFAILANPPYFDFTMHSESGSYHGFFWFYFINEQLLRFLNVRYPRDYNTVPRTLFWAFHLVWFFPWSVYLLRIRKLGFGQTSRASQTGVLCLCWIGFVLVFFTFSTTQEYYSLPTYPAIAILLGAGMAAPGKDLGRESRIAGAFASLAALAMGFILWQVRNTPTPGDIAEALSHHPDVYTLSMGHMADLTLGAFAYLRAPLLLAFGSFLIGVIASFRFQGMRAVLALAVMMAMFFQAARMALHVFDPYLGSKQLADSLNQSPPGKLIVDDQYYTFSSVFFYSNKRALLLNGRNNNLEYGSYSPTAPQVFISDADLPQRWNSPDRWYLVIDGHQIPRIERLVGKASLKQVAETGNKYLFVNH